MPPNGEEKFIAQFLAPLSKGFPGAFDLADDCAELEPLVDHSLILKTDPIVERVHFFCDDAPEDLGWKALAVNVSDLVAKGARPVAYLMALTLPAKPEPQWMERFAAGLREAQDAFGCVLIGGDTDVRAGPLSIAITIIGETRSGRMVRRAGAQPGDIVFVSGELGGAALGLQLRLDGEYGRDWSLSESDRQMALARYLRPDPKIGLRTALQAYARSAMDISDGLIKDLHRMCRLTQTGARIEFDALPMASGVRAAMAEHQATALPLITAGDDYEVLATVASDHALDFEAAALSGGVTVTRIGRVVAEDGVSLMAPDGGSIHVPTSGYDHFDHK